MHSGSILDTDGASGGHWRCRRRYGGISCARWEHCGRDPGECADKSEAWNFDKPEMRAEAEALLEQQHPLLLIGSPMCTAWSAIQAINYARRDRKWSKTRYPVRGCT